MCCGCGVACARTDAYVTRPYRFRPNCRPRPRFTTLKASSNLHVRVVSSSRPRPPHVETGEAALVRAVLVHELLHVKRGDWRALVGEELVRALHWFNPIMWWLVDRVQFAREEVVDAAAIPLVGGRRTYVRALLTFADAPPPATLAPAFARRRHLFTRITRLYEESTMSRPRAAFTALLLVVCATVGSAAAITTFPISGGEEFLVALAPEPTKKQIHRRRLRRRLLPKSSQNRCPTSRRRHRHHRHPDERGSRCSLRRCAGWSPGRRRRRTRGSTATARYRSART